METARTNYAFVRLLPNKTAPVVREALKDIRREILSKSKDSDVDVVRVHSDVDGSMQTRDWLREAGIAQTDTGGHNPQANARTERRIRMLTEAFRATLLTAAGGQEAYNALWGVGLEYQNEQANKQTFGDGTNPHTNLTGEEPEWTKEDHIFGSHAIYYVPLAARADKWETPGRRGLWVGRSNIVSGGAKVVPIQWDQGLHRWKLGEVKHVARVKVTSGEYPLKMGPDTVTGSDKAQLVKFLNKFHVGKCTPMSPDAYEEYRIEGEDPVWEVEAIESKRGKGAKAKYVVKWKGSDERTEEPRKHLVHSDYGCKELLEEFEAELKRNSRVGNPAKTTKRDKGRPRRAGLATADDGSGTPDECQQDRTAVAELIHQQRQKGGVDDWLPGYQSELREVRRRRLRKIEDKDELRTAQSSAVRLRMNLEPKHDGRKKSRLILQGFREPREWDGGPTDSPVVSLASIRMMLYMVKPAKWADDIISSIDVATAFLQAEEYDPSEPARYVKYRSHKRAEWEYYQLRGPIYGQRAASKRWYDTLSAWMVEEGFTQGKNEPCVFRKEDMVVALWVDDCLVRGTSRATTEFYAKLGKKFDIKDPTYLTQESPLTFVGFEITTALTTRPGRKRQIVGINQDVAMNRFLEDHGECSEGAPVTTPMASATDIVTDPTPIEGWRQERYQRMVGHLNYFAAATRYDVSQAVSRLSQAASKPTIGSEQALFRVMRYLKHNKRWSIATERKGQQNIFEFYADSDHAGDRSLTTKSTTGMIFLMNGAPVHWSSKKQNNRETAFSSAAAEIFALSESARAAQLLAWRAQEMGISITWPLILKVDNTQAISFQRNTCLQSRLRGVVDLRDAWVKELREIGRIATQKVGTEDNLADVLTKCMPGYKFTRKVNQINEKQLQMDVEDMEDAVATLAMMASHFSRER